MPWRRCGCSEEAGQRAAAQRAAPPLGGLSLLWAQRVQSSCAPPLDGLGFLWAQRVQSSWPLVVAPEKHLNFEHQGISWLSSG